MATNPAQYYHVVSKPLMTEKTTIIQDLNNQYTFKVHRDATKPEIRKAVETLFNEKVTAVNVITVPTILISVTISLTREQSSISLRCLGGHRLRPLRGVWADTL